MTYDNGGVDEGRPHPLPPLVSFLPSRSGARFARFSYFPLPLYFLNFSPLSVLSPLFSLIPPFLTALPLHFLLPARHLPSLLPCLSYLHRVTDITSSPNVLEVLPVIIGTSVQIWCYVVSRIFFLQKESLCLTRSFTTLLYSTTLLTIYSTS